MVMRCYRAQDPAAFGRPVTIYYGEYIPIPILSDEAPNSQDSLRPEPSGNPDAIPLDGSGGWSFG